MAKLLICLLCCCCLVVEAHAAPRSADALILCYEDQNSYPWVMTDGSGLNLQLLRLVDESLPLQFSFVAVPWKRCLSGMAQGTYDGAFASSFKEERLLLAVTRRMPMAAWMSANGCTPRSTPCTGVRAAL